MYLEKQRRLDKNERDAKSDLIANRLFGSFDFASLDFLNCFLTLEKNNEIATTQIFRRVWQNFPHIKTCAPRVNFAQNILENAAFTPDADLIANKWQILEPADDEPIDAQKLDAVIIPLIAFDKRGFRVGYGKGFYDKFLATCRHDCRKIGLSLFPPAEKIADVESFDVKLDACVTPETIFRFA